MMDDGWEVKVRDSGWVVPDQPLVRGGLSETRKHLRMFFSPPRHLTIVTLAWGSWEVTGKGDGEDECRGGLGLLPCG